MSSIRIHCCYIIIGTEFKEKHILEQDELFCCIIIQFSSVQFSRSVLSNSSQCHEPQHARPPCPSPTPRVCLNSCPLSWWCHPTISSSVVPFSSGLQPFPASGSFSNESALHISWPKYWSFSFSISPSNKHQDWSLGWTGWISLKSKGLSRVFSNTTIHKTC